MTTPTAVPAKSTGFLVLALLWSGSTGAGGALAVSAQQTRSAQSDVSISTARFWRGDGRTLVEGVLGFPIPAAGTANPVVELTVRDRAGQILTRETWTDTISERMSALARNRGGAEVTTPIQFAVSDGAYHLTVKVRRGDQADSAMVPIEGFQASPLVSDVLVSNRIRLLAEGQEATIAETRKGRYAIERGTRVTLFPNEPMLKFYMELYGTGRASGDTVNVEYAVQRESGGAPLFRTRNAVVIGERGAINAASIPVEGLPPGEYVLMTTVRAGTRQEERSSAFTMGSFENAPVVVAAPSTGGSEADMLNRYFAADKQDDRRIAQLVEALTVAPPAEPVAAGMLQLDADAQRRFLARYFSRVPDPRPATPEHDLLQEYIQRVQFVTREYAERDIGRSAVRTDRGRIYMKYGPPDARQAMPNLSGNRAVEVWKYTRSRNLKFAFLDETGFSNFNMVFTTDPTEVSAPDWQERVRDVEAIRLIQMF